MDQPPFVRRAGPEDAARIAEIHVFGWRSAYRGILSDGYLFGKMSVARRIGPFREALETGAEETYVYDDGITKGFLTVGPCRDDDRPGTFELWGIYVDRAFQGQGIGSVLYRYAESLARDRGFPRLSLWVLEGNLDTVAFYSRRGLEPDGSRRDVDFLGAPIIRMGKAL